MQKDVIDAVLHEHIILVMGTKDTGKTTFIRDLANELFRRGYSVGIIDADVGQSDIGPPATIGFGVVAFVLEHLRDVAVQHLYFVGSISPKGHLLPIITGTRKMLDKAIARGIQKILIDTTGLISGQLGRVLKEYKIAVVNPDLIICLQKDQECEHILKQYHAFDAPRILRYLPNRECRTRSQTERRNYRSISFQQYFRDARHIACSLQHIGVFGTRLFSGIPISSDELTRFSQVIMMEGTDEMLNDSQTTGSMPENSIVWAEYVHNELHLITTKRLKYHQVLSVQRSCDNAAYIKKFTIAEFKHILVGVLDTRHECCSIGILRSINFHTQQATIFTHAKPHEIAGIVFSTYKMRET